MTEEKVRECYIDMNMTVTETARELHTKIIDKFEAGGAEKCI